MSGKKGLQLVAVVRTLDGGSRNLIVRGRDAWALRKLVDAGKHGISPIETPGPRWSSYIHRLRRMSLEIETLYEWHDGPFPSSHARYVLHSSVDLIEPNEWPVVA